MELRSGSTIGRTPDSSKYCREYNWAPTDWLDSPFTPSFSGLDNADNNQDVVTSDIADRRFRADLVDDSSRVSTIPGGAAPAQPPPAPAPGPAQPPPATAAPAEDSDSDGDFCVVDEALTAAAAEARKIHNQQRLRATDPSPLTTPPAVLRQRAALAEKEREETKAHLAKARAEKEEADARLKAQKAEANAAAMKEKEGAEARLASLSLAKKKEADRRVKAQKDEADAAVRKAKQAAQARLSRLKAETEELKAAALKEKEASDAQLARLETQKLKVPWFWEGDDITTVVDRIKAPKEWKEVTGLFLGSLGEPNISKLQSIVRVQRIQNLALWQPYQAMKRTLLVRAKKEKVHKRRADGYERYGVFHGSDAITVQKIIHQGFNRSFAGRNATAYGKGVYFATNSQYSDRYTHLSSSGTKVMLICSVLVGEYCTGRRDQLTPDIRNTQTHQLHDSTTDTMDDARRQMFVVFKDPQAYPVSVVHFRFHSQRPDL
jgi:hypothetical protein